VVELLAVAIKELSPVPDKVVLPAEIEIELPKAHMPWPRVSIAVIGVLTLVSKVGLVLSPMLLRKLPLLLILLTPKGSFLLLSAGSIPAWKVLSVATFRLCLADPFQYRIGKYIGTVLAEPSSASTRKRWLIKLQKSYYRLEDWVPIVHFFEWVAKPLWKLYRRVSAPFIRFFERLLERFGLLVVFFKPSAATMLTLGAADHKHKPWQIAVADIAGTLAYLMCILGIRGNLW
jgi:hypothetical protein